LVGADAMWNRPAGELIMHVTKCSLTPQQLQRQFANHMDPKNLPGLEAAMLAVLAPLGVNAVSVDLQVDGNVVTVEATSAQIVNADQLKLALR
jgi:hypothetical protein